MTKVPSVVRKATVNRVTIPVWERMHELSARATPAPASGDSPAQALRRERARSTRLEQRLEAVRERADRKSIEVIRTRKTLGHQASLAAMLAQGLDLETAIVTFARASHGELERVESRAILQRLYGSDGQREIGAVGLGIFLAGDGLVEASLAYFREAGDALARRLAAVEYLDVWIAQDREAGLEAFRAHWDAEPITRLTRLHLLQVLAKHRALDDLWPRVAQVAAQEELAPSLEDDDAEQLGWFERLRTRDEPSYVDAPGVVNLAVMDYTLLDKRRTSSNRGDYVQTLAALSHVLRFQDVEFVGDTELAHYLQDLKADVHVDRRIHGVAARVQPVELDRDFASGRAYPDDTWLICNGWFMHRSFKGQLDFPFPDEVNPIMISFHVQDPDVLTAETVEHLRRHEPIGCRDWTTVYRLRDVGVSAFFSGCVTTTVGQVIPPAAGRGANRLALVETALDADRYAGWKVDEFTQVGPQVRDFSLVEGLEDARTMLAGYAPYDAVATSRLHCYLPARSMGLPVDFRPKNRADVRFEGLLDLSDDELAAIRGRIEGLLEVLLRSILSGASRDEVRRLWVELTADEVARAERYCTTYEPAPASSIDVPAAVARLRDTRVRIGRVPADPATEVHVALALDQNLEHELPVVLQSVLDHTDRDVTCHVMTRGLGQPYRDRLAGLFPALAFEFYDFDAIDYGADVNLLKHISVSTMDRLFLPEILADVDRVVYLDIDILVQADVGELWDAELGDNAFAAKRTRLRTWANLVKPITRASLRFEPEKAWDVRRRIHDESVLTARTFNAGILVINLALMRAEDFTATHLFLVESCAMNDQDVFNIYSRDRVVELDTRWNTVPSQDFEPEPWIIHWAGPAKPWNDHYVPFKERFEATRRAVEARG
ncbi:glycosyltransferase family 8 protein [Demequina sp. NBRC 110056]|uniref:glycosyltransferase family 8 protein n=1 Tax=Demequina sp. NBRC 110056 TaxID=1570345 RepID=UPI0009FE41FA|nr:glycosyltransferase family 8 protein [Demequina sp. NBRC 110056]